MLSSNMCFFTEYLTFYTCTFRCWTLGFFCVFWLKKMKNVLNEGKRRENVKSEHELWERFFKSFSSLKLVSLSHVDVYDHFSVYTHAESNPITQKAFSTYGTEPNHIAINQSCLSFSMCQDARCIARDKHFLFRSAPKLDVFYFGF